MNNEHNTVAPDPVIGIGGAPTRTTTLPQDAKGRKEYPVATGFLDYFPDAVVAVSRLSKVGNDQHNAGQPLHWARGKSGDEADTMMRHFLQRGTFDTDGVRHSVKMVWRALALLQKEIEAEKPFAPGFSEQAYPPQPCGVKSFDELLAAGQADMRKGAMGSK